MRVCVRKREKERWRGKKMEFDIKIEGERDTDIFRCIVHYSGKVERWKLMFEVFCHYQQAGVLF